MIKDPTGAYWRVEDIGFKQLPFFGVLKVTKNPNERVCPNCDSPDSEGLEFGYRLYQCVSCRTEFGINDKGEKVILHLTEKDDPNWTDTQHAYHNGIRLLNIFRHTKDWNKFEDALDRLTMIEDSVK